MFTWLSSVDYFDSRNYAVATIHKRGWIEGVYLDYQFKIDGRIHAIRFKPQGRNLILGVASGNSGVHILDARNMKYY